MIERRFVLKASAVGTAMMAAGAATAWTGVTNPRPTQNRESLLGYLARTGQTTDTATYARWLGAANPFKEGDEIIGVAAPNEEVRALARTLLSNTPIQEIDDLAGHRDQVWQFADNARDDAVATELADITLGELKHQLLTSSGERCATLGKGLSSDAIAAVVRLMDNDDLIAVAAKVFNPLPDSKIGAKGYMGARVQPNSPTDNPDDIRWQVFDAFAYGVGDVVLGTNPVSSETASVAAIEATLADIATTFGVQEHLPHCVLAHIDVQAEAEALAPDTTGVWFQSIAGNDEANATFDISVQKMRDHAATRNGPWGLYFETGQGADFTNGHGYGIDMVTWEARKYGFARALQRDVAQAKALAGDTREPWLHLNDVAGFIGPEVFRSKEQLVRCCLEDIVMGKLHGLCIGLDICATLHMSVSLDDLDWCIDQVMPANPAYLMALPTKIDPMLGYLTTGYQDHVRIRERFRYRVEDRMWQLFQRLEVVNADGSPGPNYGDPIAIYIAYRRAKGDLRNSGQLRNEAVEQLASVRGRGVFIAEGYGAVPSALEPSLAALIRGITDEARTCIWEQFDDGFRGQWQTALLLSTQSNDREDYILHPESGERLTPASLNSLNQWRQNTPGFNAVVVISDGLNARALKQGDQLTRLYKSLHQALKDDGWRVADTPLIIESGRVRAGYQTGEQVLKDLSGNGLLLHIIGERPGTGHNTLSVYMTLARGTVWGSTGTVDHDITRVVSGIADSALKPELAVQHIGRILPTMV